MVCVLRLRLAICFLVTVFFFVFSYSLRARHTQYGFTVVLGRQPGEHIMLYLVNRMGHA